ncbi:SsgA family sporulation/cell division regulator [Planomonospora sp. ID67723]|uniref:SsgA family sporulation/cell division regulator n=1 Tax=Planomonospora sp. ID67723 TaxID=2738134 RepID=UPI0018C3A382|nr:SsgA family sporulation/cell division regulator [Planomonospora sp. ID67723]MBG0828208.1 SsgA family sporulation/cell division regulator [Planomonospora sp. ID67723]
MSAPCVVEGLTLWPVEAPDQPLMAVVSYRADDPYAVRLAFLAGDGRETFDYLFARELLIDGLDLDQCEPLGLGDVRVGPAPAGDWLVLSLPGVDGEWFELYATRAHLAGFVEATLGVVPMGRERELVDVDAVIAAILAEVR